MISRRSFTAATLELSQLVNEEWKAKTLAAATNELERLFKKEDFGRMKVRCCFYLFVHVDPSARGTIWNCPGWFDKNDLMCQVLAIGIPGVHFLG